MGVIAGTNAGTEAQAALGLAVQGIGFEGDLQVEVGGAETVQVATAD
ncbi:hypothetical protein GME_19157 [Halomonas sp. TD01]|nr:hypothetical protein GME_19157 [Halomonas sp. TD01]